MTRDMTSAAVPPVLGSAAAGMRAGLRRLDRAAEDLVVPVNDTPDGGTEIERPSSDAPGSTTVAAPAPTTPAPATVHHDATGAMTNTMLARHEVQASAAVIRSAQAAYKAIAEMARK